MYPSVRITISKLDKKSRKVHFAKEGTEASMQSEASDYTHPSTSQVSRVNKTACVIAVTD